MGSDTSTEINDRIEKAVSEATKGLPIEDSGVSFPDLKNLSEICVDGMMYTRYVMPELMMLSGQSGRIVTPK